MTQFLEYGGHQIIKMQSCEAQTLLLLNDNLELKKYNFQIKVMKIKLIDDFRIIEDAKKLANKNNEQIQIEMTDDAVYINYAFYQIIKKQTQRDTLIDFETQREKNADKAIT